MEIEDWSHDAERVADDIQRRTERTVARFSFAFSTGKLNEAARALMSFGLQSVRVEDEGTVLQVEVPLQQLTAAVATCLAHDGNYLRLLAMPS